MTDTLYYVLFLFSVLLCMILGISALQTGNTELLNYSLLYGIILPCVYALCIFVKWLFCRVRGTLIVGNVQLCPVTIRIIPLTRTIYTYIVSLGLMMLTSIVITYLVTGFGVTVTHTLSLALTPITLIYILLLQIPVGTMEEGVFRKAIPEALSTMSMGVSPLIYALSASMLFGFLHLYVYGSIYLTITAVSAGIVNSLIYYGYLGKAMAGDITSLALAHTTYNAIVILASQEPTLAILIPIAIITGLIGFIYMYIHKIHT